MELQLLRGADFGALHALATGDWQTVTDKLTTAGDNAEKNVGGKIRDGVWEGLSGAMASATSKAKEDQLAAAVTEAKSIKWLLWKGARDLTSIQQQIEPLAKQVDEHPLLSFSDLYGSVEVAEPPSPKALMCAEFDHRTQLAAAKLAQELRPKIRELLEEATQRDAEIAKALLAATNLDDGPFDPNFNTKAPEEGWPDFDPRIFGAANWYANVVETFEKGVTDDSPPAEQSARLGAKAKELVEAGGGMCKMYDGMMVCVGAPSYAYAKSGTTYGDTFVSDYATFEELENAHPHGEKHGLIDHEKYHRDEQWRVHGYSFGSKYLGSELPGLGKENGEGGEINKYEWEAENKGGDGGYPGGYGG